MTPLGGFCVDVGRLRGELRTLGVGAFYQPRHARSNFALKPRKIPTWFALDEDRPLFAFAGLWTPWRGVRGPKSAPVEGEHELFGFLTTEPNSIVAPIHPKAMPVILTTPEEVDLWLSGETPDALKLQRPLPDELLRIVARGEKEDQPPVFRMTGS